MITRPKLDEDGELSPPERSLKEAALAYARKGYAVFPCHPASKAPRTKHGCKDATTDEKIIEDWWGKWPDANIGIATGQASGIWVLDIDGREGEFSLNKLIDEHGRLPDTLEVATGNGRHFYFILRNGISIKNSASKIGPGIDARGDGGYVIAPPSIHPSGERYRWVDDQKPGGKK
jgi:hypothetical protein